MRSLITGGTGFIGSRLAMTCLDAGEFVRVLANLDNAVQEETGAALRARGAELVVASVTDAAKVREAMRDVDLVVHLAAAQHEANVPDEHFRQVNVEGTRFVLDAAVAEGVPRLVHGSTIGVYGWTPGRTVNEDTPLEPDNHYGITKLAGEELVRSYADRIDSVIVRIGETYGPGDRRLLKLFRGIQKGVYAQIGPGTNLHHLVYVDDLVEILRRAARAQSAVGRTFVAVLEPPASTRVVVATIAEVLGARKPWLRVPLAPLLGVAAVMEGVLRPLGIQPPLHRRRMDYFRKSFAFKGEEVRQAIECPASTDLRTGIEATARWYREQGLL